jgi:hypothetical protein
VNIEANPAAPLMMAPIVEPLAASWSAWMATPGAFANGIVTETGTGR